MGILRLFVVGLAPSHELLQLGKEVKQVDFVIEDKDLSKNSVRGTKKKVRVLML